MRPKIQQRTYVARGSHSFLRALEPGNKSLCRIHVVRGSHGFVRTLDTGLPQYMYRYGAKAPLKERMGNGYTGELPSGAC